MDISHMIVFAMEIIGTIAFAASGAMTGIRKGMDLFGCPLSLEFAKSESESREGVDFG